MPVQQKKENQAEKLAELRLREARYFNEEQDDDDIAYVAYLDSIDPINMDYDDDNFMIVAVKK